MANISTRATANNILRQLAEAELIDAMQPGSGRRPTIYILKELINIAEGTK